MRRLLSFLFIAWFVLLVTNSAVLIREKEPVSLEAISIQEATYLQYDRVQIEGVGTLTVRQPISDGELEQIIRRATQFTCTYFTGRKIVTNKFPQRPSPGNVPAAACPNVLWFTNFGHADLEDAQWLIMPASEVAIGGEEFDGAVPASLWDSFSTVVGRLFGGRQQED
tara:strand:+ start:1108 stop:1611 length:504 start_codon:yes stop_codon:yes gene_type:complete